MTWRPSKGGSGVVASVYSGWLINESCLFCGAEPGEICVTVTGRAAYQCHAARGGGLSARDRTILDYHCYPHWGPRAER